MFFDALTYFSFLSEEQQAFLLRVKQSSGDDIVRLFSNYYNQLNNATVKKWIWKRPLQRINLDDYIDNMRCILPNHPLI